MRPTATWTLATGLAALLSLGFSSDGYAADPAVSRLNGKVAYDVGAFDGDGGSLGEASVSVPVADKLGLQIDAAGGKISADDYWGVGGHVFTRDPEKGLVGLIASYQALEGLHLERGGAEGELYWKGFLFRATAGYQGGNTRRGMFEGLGVKYYITENFMLESYTESAASVWLERFGFEYAPGIRALPGLSVFAEGAVGEGHYDRWLAGLRYYFGPEKSLQKRHAEDDPDSLLPDGLNLLEQKRSAKKVRVSSGSGGEGSGGEGSGGEGSGGEGSGGEGSTSPSR